jgi:Spy/CpxP family protein refolding chaperone
MDNVLKEIHAEMKAAREQSDAQFDQLRQKGRSEMRAVLTPEQMPKFDEFLKRLDEERKRNGPPAPR